MTLRTSVPLPPPCPPPSPSSSRAIMYIPTRSVSLVLACAYQQSILRTWECEMACPAMPAMLLESRCGRVDCLDSPPRSSSSPRAYPLLSSSPSHVHKYSVPSPRTPKLSSSSSVHFPLLGRVTRSCAVTSDSCTTDAARRIPYTGCALRTFSQNVYEKSDNAA